MKQAAWIAAVAASGAASASPFEVANPEAAALEAAILLKRAFPANQPFGYTPQVVACPSNTPTIRSASQLSPQETEWLQVRRNATVQPMRDFLGRLNIVGFDANAYIDHHQNNASALPNIGIAVSGGGYRAMLNGAGVVQALDSRSANSTSEGHLGGLLQSATYLAGLSGGSWLVSTIYANNGTTVDAILDPNVESGNVWQLGNSIFEGPEAGGIQILNSANYYSDLSDAVSGKENAGFNVTIADYWGRALSYQMINDTAGGPAYTFSSIAQQDWFQRGDFPLPLIVADNRAPGEQLVSTNSTVFEINPWELGSPDPSLYAFAPLQYVGTNFTNGSPNNNDACVVGFDNVGYVFGTSSSLFNAILTTVNGTNTTGWVESALQNAITRILSSIGREDNDIADWVNPFLGYNNETNVNSQDETLTLVDGGLDGQNIPLHPLIQPYRNVDVIFAVDSSADTNATFPTEDSASGWPDGISIITTYERSMSDIGNGTAFPEVPGLNTFMNLGLNTKPVFFGCDASQFSDGIPPLVVYMPNAPYVYTSNVSTFQMDYNNTERDAIVLNGYNLATQGNGTLDSQWPVCVGCAVLSRSLARTNTAVPDACNQCFERYCWNGTVDDRTPGTYNPGLYLANDAVNVEESGGLKLTSSVSFAILTVLVTAFSMM